MNVCKTGNFENFILRISLIFRPLFERSRIMRLGSLREFRMLIEAEVMSEFARFR